MISSDLNQLTHPKWQNHETLQRKRPEVSKISHRLSPKQVISRSEFSITCKEYAIICKEKSY